MPLNDSALKEFRQSALFISTDAYSKKWQIRFFIAQKFQLSALVCAAIGGATTWTLLKDFQFSAFITLVSLVFAILAKLYLVSKSPEKKWYNGRAAAESIKTLSWKYVQCALPFEKKKSKKAVDELFLKRVDEILATVPTLDVSVKAGNTQITRSMRNLRKQPLLTRKQHYIQLRVEDQITWYSDRSTLNVKRSDLWSICILALEGIALLLAILRFSRIIEIDLSGIAVTLAAAIMTWVQSKQHETLAQSYSIAAQELGKVNSILKSITKEDEWSLKVEQSEEAISREHTLWLASHR